MRFRNVEFRWSPVNNRYVLVSWYKDCNHKELCYVIAFFIKYKEGYEMKTVGDRFFEDKDAWVVGKYGMGFLTETFEMEKKEEDEYA